MTSPVSDTPIGDAIIPAPVIDTVTVVQPNAVHAVGDQVTLHDGKAGTISRIDGAMFLLADNDGDETLQHLENITS